MDTGYWMWSFQGKLLKRVYLDNFCQLLWRPRPPTLLSAEKQKEIKKSLKKYSAQFESKDRMRMTKASKELVEKRQKLMQEFEEHRKKRLQQWATLKQRRLELRNSKSFLKKWKGGVSEFQNFNFNIFFLKMLILTNWILIQQTSKKKSLNFWSKKKQPSSIESCSHFEIYILFF